MLLVFLALLSSVLANVEKAIFLGPSGSSDELAPALETPLPCLSPDARSRTLSTRLNTTFAGDGTEHWFLLDGLAESKRYEVRVCWPATQPTDFTLDVYTADKLPNSDLRSNRKITTVDVPRLYLRVLAKTAYYTDNIARMQNPDPVDVELILDPFLLGILPESLLPVGSMLVIITVAGWIISGWIARFLAALVEEGKEQKEGIERKDR